MESPVPPSAARPRRALPLRRRVLFACIALITLSLLAFVVLEIIVRIANGAGCTPLGPYDRLPGGTFKLSGRMPGTNSHGYNDREHELAKIPLEFRLVIMGDSYVWGMGPYEQNYPKLLEDRLNALRPSRPIEVINLGQPGYGPTETLNLWRHEAPRCQADAAIYGFYLGNDFTDPSSIEARRAVLGEYLVLRKDRLADRSLFLALFRQKWRTRRIQGHLGPLGAEPPAEDPALAGMWSYHLSLFEPDFTGRLAWQTPVVRSLLAELKTYSDGQGVPLFVLGYPSQLMVDPGLQKLISGREGKSPADYDFSQLWRWMDATLTELQIPHTDISPQIAAQPVPGQLYVGTHWNAAGNQAAAAAMEQPVREFLENQGLTFGDP